MRLDPEPAASELDLLAQYLDYQRETIVLKTADLDAGQLHEKLAPSQLTLGGLLYHLALVEETWLEVRFAGLPERAPWIGVDWEADPNWEFHAAGNQGGGQLLRRYSDACERSRRVISSAADSAQLSVMPRRDGRHFSLRWVLLHLIEETARHAGHADLLREALDGTVGE